MSLVKIKIIEQYSNLSFPKINSKENVLTLFENAKNIVLLILL